MGTTDRSIPLERYACGGCGSIFAPVENAPEIRPRAGAEEYQRDGECPVCGAEEPLMTRHR